MAACRARRHAWRSVTHRPAAACRARRHAWRSVTHRPAAACRARRHAWRSVTHRPVAACRARRHAWRSVTHRPAAACRARCHAWRSVTHRPAVVGSRLGGFTRRCNRCNSCNKCNRCSRGGLENRRFHPQLGGSEVAPRHGVEPLPHHQVLVVQLLQRDRQWPSVAVTSRHWPSLAVTGRHWPSPSLAVTNQHYHGSRHCLSCRFCTCTRWAYARLLTLPLLSLHSTARALPTCGK